MWKLEAKKSRKLPRADICDNTIYIYSNPKPKTEFVTLSKKRSFLCMWLQKMQNVKI